MELLTFKEHAKINAAIRARKFAGRRFNEQKFDKIFFDLKNKIETREYPFNAILPSEHDLIKIYNCTRTPVRRALAELISRGYVQVRQGSRVRVIYEPIERNGFKIGDELYDVRRVRYVNDKPLILDKNYFLASVVKDLTEEIAESSIYDYLENTLKMKIMTSKRRMTTELATTEDKMHLELGDYNCLAIVSGRVFNDAGLQFEYTESRHRPDYFCFEDTATRHRSKLL